MTESPYASVSVGELVKRFEETCLEQYDTYVTGDINLYNSGYDTQVDIVKELTFRGPDARRSLMVLLTHENPQVRLRAAKRVYPVAREEARRCLEDLAASGWPDQSLAAGMTLSRLEDVPDCLDH
ncbi:DUF2019 domain-containing protein [Roseiarcus fermentans]|uniref:DUF2019 domain-containing protein n=1 Tax=Roseiarcus fermentans TaxID=1473586 RepID=UPI0014739EFB